MGLVSVFKDVEARVTEIVGSIGEKIPNMGLGENAKFKHEAPPRIVWVPTAGPIKKPNQAGGDQRSNPRQLWLRELNVQARIWHVDIESAEALAGHMLAAMSEGQHGAHRVMGEAWDTSGVQQLGVQLVLTLAIQLPFTDVTSEVTTVGSASLSSGFAPEGS